VQDVVRGEMQLACDTLLMMEFVRAGKLHAIGVMSKTRAESAPDVPTFIELGLPGVAASISFALYAPAGTPPAIIDILNREANKALNEPSVIRGIRLLGGTPEGGTAERLAAILQEDRVRWQKLISSLNLDLSE
jgi:tripartite-type tricarboxylate transporter receptor subunit TctC